MGEKIERWAPTLAVVLALLAAVAPASFYLGGLHQGQADLKERLDGVKADVAAMETRMVALFADQLRDNRRDVADMRERVSALEAGS